MKLQGARARSFGVLILVLALFGSFEVRAWPPEIAPELNFTNPKIVAGWRGQKDLADTSNPANLEVQQKFRDEVAKSCATCTIQELKDKYGVRKFRVVFSDGWYFDITLDPAVVEITSKPLTQNDLGSSGRGAVMQKLIWETAKQVELEVGNTGHINFGVESTFGQDALLFRNFIVDYLNHAGLLESGLGHFDTANAPHPERLSAPQREAIAKLFKEFDPKKQTIRDLAKGLYEHVYYKSTVFGGGDGEPPQKYHALNISSLVNPGDTWPRLELRAIGMQASVEELALLSKLFTARVEFLRSKRAPLEYTANKRYQSGRYTGTLADSVEDFYRYVTESGLRWEDYRRFPLKRSEMSEFVSAFEKKLEAERNSKIDKLGDALSGDCH